MVFKKHLQGSIKSYGTKRMRRECNAIKVLKRKMKIDLLYIPGEYENTHYQKHKNLVFLENINLNSE